LPGVIDFTPVAFVSNYFKYWRGSMVFRFKVVRTEFHSGRLSVAFFPTEVSASNPSVPLFTDAHYVNRHIIDIRESTEFTITVPYINSAPWLDIDDAQYTGLLVVYVEDQLKAPATVSQTVRIITEVAGGPDIEFAYPSNAFLTPALKAVQQSGESSREAPTNVCAILESNIGGSSSNENDIVNSAMCIGEKINSFRTLVKSFNSLPNTTSGLTAGAFWAVVPFAVPWWTSDLITPIAPAFTSDLYGVLCSIFLFSRGGVRWKAVPVYTAATELDAKARISYLVPMINGSPARTTSIVPGAVDISGNPPIAGAFSHGPKVISRTTNAQPIELTVPQYYRWHSRVNAIHITDAAPYSTARPSMATPTLLQIAPLGSAALNSGKMVFFRAGSDDTNFGVFISIPPMVRSAASNYA
jgi:hypothetical protein